MKIGIFGGSFNPVHKVHLEIVKKVLENKVVDRVIIIPTGDAYDKHELAPFYHRKAMLEIALNEENLSNVIISDLENMGKRMYTYQTLDYFKQQYDKDDEIFFILGADNIDEFETWRNYEYILENYKLLVFGRNELNIKNIIKDMYKNLSLNTNKNINTNVNTNTNTNKIKNNIKNNIKIINFDEKKISSSEIRKNINRFLNSKDKTKFSGSSELSQNSIQNYLNKGVQEYIIANNLYKT